MAYPLETHSILLTNVNGDGDDVLCYTTLSVETLAKAYAVTGKVTWDEMYLVPPDDRQYYIHEPCWLSVAEEAMARRLASKRKGRFDAMVQRR